MKDRDNRDRERQTDKYVEIKREICMRQRDIKKCMKNIL